MSMTSRKVDTEVLPSVFIEDDVLTITDFRETDHRVVEIMREAEHPDHTLHQMLEQGARCLGDASVRLQAQTVATEFARLSANFDRTVQQSTDAVSTAAERLLGDGGTVPEALAEFRRAFTDVLDGAFDGDSKSSIMSKLDDLLVAHNERMSAGLAAQLDLTVPDSALSRSRKEILETLGEFRAEVNKELKELEKGLAVQRARSEEREKGAGKGLDYEAALHDVVQPIVAVFQDVAEFKGSETGALPGSKVGDEVVTLAAMDVGGREARYVIEAKDRKISSVSKVLAELDDAMANREAIVGLAVFSSQDKAPTTTPLEVFDGGRKVILVAEKSEDGDFEPDALLSLRLACAWARWMAVRSVSTESLVDDLDTEAISEAVRQAQAALALASTVRRSHTTASNEIKKAGSQVDKICEGILESLAAIESEISKGR